MSAHAWGGRLAALLLLGALGSCLPRQVAALSTAAASSSSKEGPSPEHVAHSQGAQSSNLTRLARERVSFRSDNSDLDKDKDLGRSVNLDRDTRAQVAQSSNLTQLAKAKLSFRSGSVDIDFDKDKDSGRIANLDRDKEVDTDADEELHSVGHHSADSFPSGPWQGDYQAMQQWPAALKKVREAPHTKAAVLYVQLGPWPAYIKYVVRSAAANNATTFYFIGPKFDELEGCANCMWLPFDLSFAKTRIQTLLGVGEADMAHLYPTKMCDFKPMWPTLFPEVAARHDWIGFADFDIILGDIDSEIAALPRHAELLVPRGFFPQPLANGNFMMFRTTKKMLQAFKQAGNWDSIIRNHNYLGFDEWWGVKPSMMEILAGMHINGELEAVPTQKPLIQDFTVTRPGGFFGAGVDQNATVQVYWNKGKLAAKRSGMCVCPEPNSFQFAFMPLSGCSECMRQPQGGILPDITVNRTVEAMGFHFQAWKKKKVWKDCEQNCDGWMPTCHESQGFHFGPRGFSCWGAKVVAPPKQNQTQQQPEAKLVSLQATTRRGWLGRLFSHKD